MSYEKEVAASGSQVSMVTSARRHASPVSGYSLIVLVSALSGCLDRPIGNSQPVTTNVVVQKQSNDAITSIDLLVLIDNSASMADKQETLAVAVPQLLKQLVQPQCVDETGKPFSPPIVASLGATQPCAQGSPEFNPVNDIHIGIVTSSLGDHGQGIRCTEGQPSNYKEPVTNADGTTQKVDILLPADVNDKSHLMATLQRGAARLAGDSQARSTSTARVTDQGFLAWGGTAPESSTPGTNDLKQPQPCSETWSARRTRRDAASRRSWKVGSGSSSILPHRCCPSRCRLTALRHGWASTTCC